ncbi:MAG TPA: 2OG-Fe(II) oxygenase [Thermoanaerobaculia bacterium]|jgi:hypothetical protein
MPVIEATRGGVFLRDRAALAAMRETFARQHVVRLPGFVAPELLAAARAHIERGTFAPRADEGIAVELALAENRALDLLLFVMNAPAMTAALGEIAGVHVPSTFVGRIYRFDPAVAHHDSWHDDSASGARLAGMSVNLGEPFAGGEFQIREKARPDDVVTIANTGAGDAILFAIASHLEHRVRQVEGAAAKTAFAGWFVRSEKDYWTLLREARG